MSDEVIGHTVIPLKHAVGLGSKWIEIRADSKELGRVCILMYCIVYLVPTFDLQYSCVLLTLFNVNSRGTIRVKNLLVKSL
jgi:hypothetical protein